MHVLLLTLALVTQPQHPDTATFVIRLGNDTLAVERFVFDGHVLDGVSVLRSPRVTVRRYHAELAAGGRPDSLTIAAGPAGAPPIQTVTYRYRDDSVAVEMRRDTLMRRRVVAAPGRPLPFSPDLLGPWGVALRAALAGGAGDVRLAMLAGGATIEYVVQRDGGDTLDLLIDDRDYGPLRARLDGSGRLQSLDLRASNDRYLAERVAALDVDSLTAVFAARELAGAGLGALSPRDTVRATVGGAHVMVDYGRPAMRGRRIFGALVPWDSVWRTGANEATQLFTDRDLLIGGTLVPAGTYSLFTIPSPGMWQLIINRQHGQWGTVYDAQQDLARISMRVRTADTPIEQFAIRMIQGANRSTLVIAWEGTEAVVEVRAP